MIGRRELTKGLDLGGRVFLHSYDYREDPNNRLLEVLLTGPQVVAPVDQYGALFLRGRQ